MVHHRMYILRCYMVHCEMVYYISHMVHRWNEKAEFVMPAIQAFALFVGLVCFPFWFTLEEKQDYKFLTIPGTAKGLLPPMMKRELTINITVTKHLYIYHFHQVLKTVSWI